jgi:hypothetical protein
MVKNRSAKPRRREPAGRDPDVFEVSLRAPDREALAGAIRDLGLDIDHQRPGVAEAQGEIGVTAFVTAAQIEELRGRGWKVRVEKNLSEVGRARQKEVAAGDRFKGGKVAPTGLGKKNREDR